MTSKRIPVRLSPQQYRALEKLSVKFGLDITNTIRHCIARVIDQELEPKDKPKSNPTTER